MEIENIEGLDKSEVLAQFGKEVGDLRSKREQLLTLRQGYIDRLDQIANAKNTLFGLLDEEMLIEFPIFLTIPERTLSFYFEEAKASPIIAKVFGKYEAQHIELDIEAANIAELHKKNLEEDLYLTETEAKIFTQYQEYAESVGGEVPDVLELINSFPAPQEISIQMDAKVLAILTELEIIHIESRDRIQSVVNDDNQFVMSEESKALMRNDQGSTDALVNDAELMSMVKSEQRVRPFWIIAGIAVATYIFLG